MRTAQGGSSTHQPLATLARRQVRRAAQCRAKKRSLHTRRARGSVHQRANVLANRSVLNRMPILAQKWETKWETKVETKWARERGQGLETRMREQKAREDKALKALKALKARNALKETDKDKDKDKEAKMKKKTEGETEMN